MAVKVASSSSFFRPSLLRNSNKPQRLSRARLTEICARLRLSLIRLCLPLLCEGCRGAFSLFIHKLDKPLPLDLLCEPCRGRLGTHKNVSSSSSSSSSSPSSSISLSLPSSTYQKSNTEEHQPQKSSSTVKSLPSVVRKFERNITKSIITHGSTKTRRRSTAPAIMMSPTELAVRMPPKVSAIQTPSWRRIDTVQTSSLPFSPYTTSPIKSSSYSLRHRPYEKMEQRGSLLRPGVLDQLLMIM